MSSLAMKPAASRAAYGKAKWTSPHRRGWWGESSGSPRDSSAKGQEPARRIECKARCAWVSAAGIHGEIWGDMGRYGEIWGDMG